MTTRIYGTATAQPDHTATQTHSHRFMSRVIEARMSGIEQERALMYLDGIHEGCGIDRRYSVIEDFTRSDPGEFTFFPDNWRLEPFPSTKQRMQLYESASIDLAEKSGQQALDDAGVEADEVTHLIFVTCTGLFAPGPDILLVDRLGLRPDTRRTVIGFMGCYGAFNGMRTADQIVASDPEAVVLQICVELCSLHYQFNGDPETIVGNCLFGDGAAATVYADEKRYDDGACDVVSTHCQITADSLDQMQWHIGDHGFSMVLDVEIPDTLREGGSAFIDELIGRQGLERGDVDGWLVHPGGPRIVDAVRDAAGIDEEDVALSRTVLRDFGNMSSATALYVLDRQLERTGGAGPMVMLGFGPGLTMEGAVLERL